jgi:hypothetical protein
MPQIIIFYEGLWNYVATRERYALDVTLGLRKIRSPPTVIVITNLSRIRNDFSGV